MDKFKKIKAEEIRPSNAVDIEWKCPSCKSYNLAFRRPNPAGEEAGYILINCPTCDEMFRIS